jgi:SAM-dependent methyltransferase
VNDAEHWEQIYATRSSREVGWYAPHLKTSLKWIAELELATQDPIIDVGGGASTLVDDLLLAGHENLTVLELSESAIGLSRKRLAAECDSVTWLQGDVTQIELPAGYFELWHDRAVFHFLAEPAQQQRYRDALLRALKPGGYFMIGVFDLDAPPRCSGLPVKRYSAEILCNNFAREFRLQRHHHEIHRTPSGVEQSYVYCLFQRVA